MAKFKKATALKQQSTKTDTPQEASFQEGNEVKILKEWKRHYLVQDSGGKLYNVLKELIDPS
ncbi:MAG: hypothetical protein HY538_01290 [Deltaproteobacteria bacterium]|nr:hypothetical protein [Deltaproteobacteria bacterium]